MPCSNLTITPHHRLMTTHAALPAPSRSSGPVTHLSGVVEEPLFAGLVLVGDHRLGHVVAYRAAHPVQQLVQPLLHLPRDRAGGSW